MAFDLIIFDMDGTLVDSEPIANRVFYEKLVALGLPPRFDEASIAADLTGLALSTCFDIVRDRYGIILMAKSPPALANPGPRAPYGRAARPARSGSGRGHGGGTAWH